LSHEFGEVQQSLDELPKPNEPSLFEGKYSTMRELELLCFPNGAPACTDAKQFSPTVLKQQDLVIRLPKFKKHLIK
jgi:hypothetical protein